ncbi:MAG: DUF523 domain-containing protein [Sarcina sp.]
MIIVSACLCGENCKYNGGNNNNEVVKKFIENKEVLYVCPEQIGGLLTPRNPAEIVGCAKGVLNGEDKIISNEGKDVTFEFLKGAREVLKIAKDKNVKLAILKAKSPSCGKGLIYDGTFTGHKIKGNGVTAQLLIDNGVKVINEDEF